ncbi:ABC transporter ATP-binding protein/permease [Alphaproteobacteria bacterium]|nr:ABC transporter ATP-binding protein/permease [Alphaproteobacteria bacterium]
MIKIIKNIWKLLTIKRKIQSLLIICLTSFVALTEILLLFSFMLMIDNIISPEKTNFSNMFTKYFIDLSNLDFKVNSFLFSFFVFCALITGFLRLFLLWATIRFAFISASDFAKNIFYNTINQPLKYHLNNSSNEMLNGLTKKIQLLSVEVILPTIILISNFFMIIFICFFISLMVGVQNIFIIILIILATYLFIWKYSKKIINKNSLIIARNSDELVKFINESYSIIRLILLKNLQILFTPMFDKINRKLKIAESTNLFIAQGTRILIETLFILSFTIAIFISLQNSEINVILPIIGTLALATLRLLPITQRVYQSYITMRSSYHSFFDILKYLNLDNEPNSSRKKKNINFNETIQLNNVSFSYNRDKKVFNNLNLSFEKGKVTLIKGKTGSGKSTLISILMGLLAPETGNLLVDKKVINNKNLKSWQNMISYMPQDSIILDKSLFENIIFFNPHDLEQNEIIKKLKIFNLEKFINKYLNNPHYNLGEFGKNLSGGEKQRINFLRTLVENKSILILDEPSSALDVITTNKIFYDLKNNYKNLTILVISHDPEIKKFADKIIKI